MIKKMKNKIFPITVYLTQEQIEDAYRQSLGKNGVRLALLHYCNTTIIFLYRLYPPPSFFLSYL